MQVSCMEQSTQSQRDNPEGWDGEGGRRGAQDRGDVSTPVADSCQCMAKTTIIL